MQSKDDRRAGEVAAAAAAGGAGEVPAGAAAPPQAEGGGAEEPDPGEGQGQGELQGEDEECHTDRGQNYSVAPKICVFDPDQGGSGFFRRSGSGLRKHGFESIHIICFNFLKRDQHKFIQILKNKIHNFHNKPVFNLL